MDMWTLLHVCRFNPCLGRCFNSCLRPFKRVCGSMFVCLGLHATQNFTPFQRLTNNTRSLGEDSPTRALKSARLAAAQLLNLSVPLHHLYFIFQTPGCWQPGRPPAAPSTLLPACLPARWWKQRQKKTDYIWPMHPCSRKGDVRRVRVCFFTKELIIFNRAGTDKTFYWFKLGILIFYIDCDISFTAYFFTLAKSDVCPSPKKNLMFAILKNDFAISLFVYSLFSVINTLNMLCLV